MDSTETRLTSSHSEATLPSPASAAVCLSKPKWINHLDDKKKRHSIFAVDIDAAGKRLATGCLDSTIKIWDLELAIKEAVEADEENDAVAPILESRITTGLLATMARHSGAVLCVRWSPMASPTDAMQLLATGSDDTVIIIWQRDDAAKPQGVFGVGFGESGTEHYRVVKRLTGHHSDVVGLSWSPDGRFLASVGLDNSIIVWEVGAGFAQLQRLEAHTGFVKGVAWDPLSRYLFTQSDDRSAIVWRTVDWKQEARITEPFVRSMDTTYFRRPSWAPDGSAIAMANAFNGLRPAAVLAERGTWTTDVAFIGHEAPIEVVQFSPRMYCSDPGLPLESKSPFCICAIGGQDGTLSVWTSACPRPMVVLAELFSQSIMDISWAADGLVLVAASFDGTVAAIKLDPALIGTPLSVAEQRRSLGQVEAGGKTLADMTFCSPLLLEYEKKVAAVKDEFDRKWELRSSSKPMVADFEKPVDAAAAAAARPSPLPATTESTAQQTTQTVTKTKDGKRRITPQLIEPLGGTIQPFRQAAASTLIESDDQVPNAPGRPLMKQRPLKTHEEPTLIKVASTLPPVNLLVPEPRPILQSMLKLGQQSIIFEVHNQLKASQGKISCVSNGRRIWSERFSAAITHVTSSENHVSISLGSCRMLVFSLAGRRLFPPVVLDSEAAALTASGDHLLVITAAGTLRMWLVGELDCLAAASLNGLCALSQDALSIVDANIAADASSVSVALSNGKRFMYQISSKCWIALEEDPAILLNEYCKDIANTQRRLAQNSSLTDLDLIGQALEVDLDLARSRAISYLEEQIGAAGLAKDGTGYRKWMGAYILRLAREHKLAKLREVLEELVGPISGLPTTSTKWQPTTMGLDKRKLLEELLPLLAVNRALSELAEEFSLLLARSRACHS